MAERQLLAATAKPSELSRVRVDDWLAPLACSSLPVQLRCTSSVLRVRRKGALQLRVQRQHFGQGAVVVDALGQRLPGTGPARLAARCRFRREQLPPWCQAHWLAMNTLATAPVSRISSVQNWRRRGRRHGSVR